jgi:SAM-dependent methyltransferase
MNSIEYMEAELAIAKDANHPGHLMPDIRGRRDILDLGGGMGQTTFALPLDVDQTVCVVDIDHHAIAEGRSRGKTHASIWFHEVDRKNPVPFLDSTFDLVYARVSLPYMHIDKTLKEVHRVLKTGGRVWLALHSFRHTLKMLRAALRKRDVIHALRISYVIVNGTLLHLTGVQASWPLAETFQTERSMRRAFRRSGLHLVSTEYGKGFVMQADKARGE